jgi:hypothetical protein
MEITIKDLKTKINLINTIDLSINDKLSYGVKKLQNKIKESTKEASDLFNENLEDSKIDLCDKDEKGLIITDEKGNYSFKNVHNVKYLNNKIKELTNVYDNTIVIIDPYIVKKEDSSRIEDLDLFLIDELKELLF